MTVRIPQHVREAADRVGTNLDRSLVLQALAMYDAGWPPARISEALMIGRTTVMGWRRASGLPLNGSVNWHRNLDPAKVAETVRLYESGMSIAEVGRHLGVAQGAIHTRLRRAGVRMRPARVPRELLAVQSPDGYVATSEAQKITGLDRKTINQHAAAGDIAGATRVLHRGGHVWVMPRSSLDDLMQRVKPRRRRPRAGSEDTAAAPTPQMGKAREVKEWLPAGPLAAWATAHAKSVGELADGVDSIERGLRRMIVGEQRAVALGWADAFLTRVGGHLNDVWPDLDEAIAQGHRLQYASQDRKVQIAAEREATLDRIRSEMAAEDGEGKAA